MKERVKRISNLVDNIIAAQDVISNKFDVLMKRVSYADKTESDKLIEEINGLISETDEAIKEIEKDPEACSEYQKETFMPLGNLFEEIRNGTELVKIGIEAGQLKRQVEEEYDHE